MYGKALNIHTNWFTLITLICFQGRVLDLKGKLALFPVGLLLFSFSFFVFFPFFQDIYEYLFYGYTDITQIHIFFNSQSTAKIFVRATGKW